MMRPRMAAGALAGTAVALGIAACGGGQDARSDPEASDPPAQTKAAQVDPGSPDPLAELEADLRGAGYRVAEEPAGDAQGALSAESQDGARLSISYYADPAEARAVSEEIEQVFAEAPPGRGLVAEHGSFVIFVAEERKLRASERRDLAEVAELARNIE